MHHQLAGWQLFPARHADLHTGTEAGCERAAVQLSNGRGTNGTQCRRVHDDVGQQWRDPDADVSSGRTHGDP